jgi:SAM-dependent methyltransferase
VTYAKFSQHRSMVFDVERNAAYERALRRLVTPDSVVLDLGAGLGLLGLLAARLGARKVYLVEPEPVLRLAPELARRAGVAARIEILQGRIEDLQLPEPVDLILSVFTGNLLYSEDLLPALFHARDRWLKPGGAMLPDRAELRLTPVAAPELHAKYVAVWSGAASGLDMSPARRFVANELIWPQRDELQVVPLAAPLVLSSSDFTAANSADCNGEAACTAEVAGLCHGLLASMRVRLGEEWLDTGDISKGLHWSTPLLPLDPPVPVAVGETIGVSLQRRFAGDWSWGLRTGAGQRRHGESLARADLADRLRYAAADFQPLLNESGAAMQFLLERFDGTHDNAALVVALQQAFPGRFASGAAARAFVHYVVQRFAGPGWHLPGTRTEDPG